MQNYMTVQKNINNSYFGRNTANIKVKKTAKFLTYCKAHRLVTHKTAELNFINLRVVNIIAVYIIYTALELITLFFSFRMYQPTMGLHIIIKRHFLHLLL